jgi:hypothetical protein
VKQCKEKIKKTSNAETKKIISQKPQEPQNPEFGEFEGE